MQRSSRAAGRPEHLAIALGLGLTVYATTHGPIGRAVWPSTRALFFIVVPAAALCAVAAVYVIARSWAANAAEGGLIGGGLFVMSVLPLVHGLTAPGVLYGPNDAVMTSAYVALPIAVLCVSPLLLPASVVTRGIGRRWRLWVTAWMAASTALAVTLLVRPDTLSLPARTSTLNLSVVAVSLVVTIGWSLREIRLFAISARPANLLAAEACVFLALTSLVWLGERPFSVGFWMVHALDIVGVFGGCYAVFRGYRLDGPIADAIAPITARDPLRALEVGLAPIVHRYVAALERKDRITRDHVVRVSELAIRLGDAMRLRPHQLRDLGIAALLHDVGKLDTPDDILHKPGRLDAAELVIMQRHVVVGADIVAAVASLAGAAAFVRAHHERLDGRGYPSGLSGDAIPLEARIISVCDAFDAMVHTRQYRVGMGRDKAAAILREHAGSQWDAHVVDALLALDIPADRPALDAVGRDAQLGEGLHSSCACEDALPDAVRSTLLGVG